MSHYKDTPGRAKPKRKETELRLRMVRIAIRDGQGILQGRDRLLE